MKMKLTRAQFFSLYIILDNMLMGEAVPVGIEAKLLHGVLMAVYKKFYRKALDRTKEKFTISMEVHEACAWFTFFSKVRPDNIQPFEANLIQTINNSIHQKFS